MENIGIGNFSTFCWISSIFIYRKFYFNKSNHRDCKGFIDVGHEVAGATLKLQKRSRFRTRSEIHTKVICCGSNEEYESCIQLLITSHDNVLCMHATLGSNDSNVNCMKRRSSNVVNFNGKNIWDISAYQALGNISVACVDYSDYFGNFLLSDNVLLTRILRSIYAADLKYIIIKNKGLARHAHNYMSAHNFFIYNQKQIEVETKLPTLSSGEERVELTSAKPPLYFTNKFYQDPIVICTVGVVEYRSVISSIIRPHDKVLEIGCARGTTVAMIAPYIFDSPNATAYLSPSSSSSGSPTAADTPLQGLCIGLDVSKICVENAKNDHKILLQKYPHNISFVVGDAWDIPSLMELSNEFNVIFVDVGGISGSDGDMDGISLIRQLMCLYNNRDPKCQLRYIVVKSICLRHHANTFYNAFDILHSK